MMEDTWVITAVIGILVVYFFYWLKQSNKAYWENQGVVCSDTIPIIGMLSNLFLAKKNTSESINEIYWKFEGEKFIGMDQFLNKTLMVRDPDFVNQVLTKEFSHFEDRGPPVEGPKDLFSLAFSNLTGDVWRTARHKLTPTFTSGKMKNMFGPIKECSKDVVLYLNDKTDQDLDIRQIMTKYVLNVIGNIAFGIKIDTLNEKDEKSKEFFKYCTTFFKPSVLIMTKFLISLLIPKLRNIVRFKLTDEGVETFFRKLTEDIIKYREGSDAKRNDFIQLMLDEKKKEQNILRKGLNSNDVSLYEELPIDSEDKELMDQLKNTPLATKQTSVSELFTDEFIAAQTFIFISGGSETTAASLAFIIFELAQNQELQKKVQEEIREVIYDSELNYESVKKLTYMEQFIYETFRLHPILPLLMRVCSKEYKVPGTKIVIRKGDIVNIPLCALHKDPQYFPEPEKFDPDRFRDMNAIPKGVYYPFGGGPRMCIAMRLAMLEMKVLLATLLSKYTITLSEKTNVPLKLMKSAFLVCVEGGIWVKLHKNKPEL